MAKSEILAVAFTDLNGNDKYNPGKDALIAKLVDTSNDGVASVGDTIFWGTYPEIPAGSNSGTGGTFQAFNLDASSTVTAVSFIDSTSIQVDTAQGPVTWVASPVGEVFLSAGGTEALLVDSFNDEGNDVIFVDPSAPGPGNPTTLINEPPVLQVGDQAFLDVLLFL